MKNLTFLEKLEFLEKVTPRPPGVDILGNIRVQNWEKWGKNQDLRNKLCILPEFSLLFIISEFPYAANLRFSFSKICKICKIMMFATFMKKNGYPKVVFCKIERASRCILKGRYPLSPVCLLTILAWFCYFVNPKFSKT